MKINEIFYSISGESIQAGRLAIFIRTFGCPCRCSYCDSMYAVEGTDYKEMSIEDILTEIKQYDCKYVVLTGGEPLIQSDSNELIRALVENSYHVEIETCGAVDITPLEDIEDITITMDWKCPSSGMLDKMLESNLEHLAPYDVLKCVVGSEEDLDEMARVSKLTSAQVFVSPVFGKIEPKEIVEYLMNNSLTDVRMQLQIHKFIWPVDMRGV